VFRVHWLPLLAPAVLGAGCADLPDYPPPPQREALPRPDSAGLSYFVSMSNPNAAAYIVQGIGGNTEGSGYRWAFAHPVLRFHIPAIEHPKFILDFALPSETFRVTGPVTLTIAFNGHMFDRPRFDTAGLQHYEREVPPGLLHPDSINLVSIDPDKVYTAPADGVKLGFPLARAGFIE